MRWPTWLLAIAWMWKNLYQIPILQNQVDQNSHPEKILWHCTNGVELQRSCDPHLHMSANKHTNDLTWKSAAHSLSTSQWTAWQPGNFILLVNLFTVVWILPHWQLMPIYIFELTNNLWSCCVVNSLYLDKSILGYSLHIWTTMVPLQQGIRYVSSSNNLDWYQGSPSLLVSGRMGVLSLEGRQPEHEGDHSPASSAKVNNEWSYTTTPSYTFMTCTRTTG